MHFHRGSTCGSGKEQEAISPPGPKGSFFCLTVVTTRSPSGALLPDGGDRAVQSGVQTAMGPLEVGGGDPKEERTRQFQCGLGLWVTDGLSDGFPGTNRLLCYRPQNMLGADLNI